METLPVRPMKTTIANPDKIKLFASNSRFTDDSVLTLATADLFLLNAASDDKIKKEPWDKYNLSSYTQVYREWGNRYPKAGYGC